MKEVGRKWREYFEEFGIEYEGEIEYYKVLRDVEHKKDVLYLPLPMKRTFVGWLNGVKVSTRKHPNKIFLIGCSKCNRERFYSGEYSELSEFDLVPWEQVKR